VWVLVSSYLPPKNLVLLASTCRGLQGLQPRMLACTPAAVQELAFASKHWASAANLRLCLSGLPWNRSPAVAQMLKQICRGASDVRGLVGLKFTDENRGDDMSFTPLLSALLGTPGLQKAHVYADAIWVVPCMGAMRKLKLDIADGIPEEAFEALSQLGSLQYLALCSRRASRPSARVLDLHASHHLLEAGCRNVVLEQLHLPLGCKVALDAPMQTCISIWEDIRLSVQSLDSLCEGQDVPAAVGRIVGDRRCQFLTQVAMAGAAFGTMHAPVCVSLPCVRSLRLYADGALHLHLHALPRVLALRAGASQASDITLSLDIKSPAELAVGMQSMSIRHRSGQGPAHPSMHSLVALLDGLCARPATERGSGLVEGDGYSGLEVPSDRESAYYFSVPRQEGDSCQCRACRWTCDRGEHGPLDGVLWNGDGWDDPIPVTDDDSCPFMSSDDSE
jgi:hypothetical protein